MIQPHVYFEEMLRPLQPLGMNASRNTVITVGTYTPLSAVVQATLSRDAFSEDANHGTAPLT